MRRHYRARVPDPTAALDLIVRHLAAGTIDERQAARAIRALIGDVVAAEPPSTLGALTALAGMEGADFQSVRNRLHQARLAQAQRWHERRAKGEADDAALARDLADLPLHATRPWASQAETLSAIRRWLRLQREARTAARATTPTLTAAIAAAAQVERAAIAAGPWPWHAGAAESPARLIEACRVGAPGPLAELLDRIAAWNAARVDAADGAVAALRADLDVPAAHAAALDRALLWPDDRVRPLIATLAGTSWAEDRVALVLALRFGRFDGDVAWTQALARQEAELGMRVRAAVHDLHAQRLDLLRLWCGLQPDADPAWLAALADAAEPLAADPEVMVRTWSGRIPSDEVDVLLGITPNAAQRAGPRPPAVAEAAVGAAPDVVRARPPGREPAPPPAPPPIWRAHVRRYLTENWFLVAGLAMLVIGPALLASYAWDRHWLVRFTIIPVCLAGLTLLIGECGRWLERVDASLRGTAAALRGAAIGLIPVNAMAVALLARDPQVGGKAWLVPLVAAVYAACGWWALARWTRAVMPTIGTTVAAATAAALAPLLLPPLALAWTGRTPGPVGLAVAAHVALIAAGFGFIAALRALDATSARDAVLVAFGLAALAGGWLGGVVWSHLAAGVMPWWPAFAVAAVAIALLAFVAERRLIALGLRGALLGPEAWTGFAALAAAVAFGAGDPLVRPVALVAAGVAWIAQARVRGAAEALHQWIGLTLIVIAGATVALIPEFPRAWTPAIGLALIALGYLATAATASASLTAAIRGMQGALTVLTASAAVIAQWHLGSPPLATAGAIAACALVAGWHARGAGTGWTHVAMALAAAALPYVGLVDLDRSTLHGNHLVAGFAALSVLWIAWCRLFPTGAARPARSTVLWAYGALAVAAMALRVLIEGERVVDATPLFVALDHLGPLAMTAVLAYAAWTSRSLVPSAMAIGIAVILLPELRANLEQLDIAFGSGLGGAGSALLLAAAALRLRRSPRLAALAPGDRLTATIEFPLRRLDHTLVTWPLIGAATFLLVKLDTVVLARHWPQPPVRTGCAIMLGGAAWMLVAAYARRSWATWLGWGGLVLGAAAIHGRVAEPAAWSDTLAIVLALVAVGEIALAAFARRQAWAAPVLADPARLMLAGTTAVAGTCALIALAGAPDWSRVLPLAALTGAAALWLALRDHGLLFGWLAWGLAGITALAVGLPGIGTTLARATRLPTSSAPYLFVIGSLLVAALVEVAPALRRRLWPVICPAQRGASAAIAILACVLVPAAMAGDAGPLVPGLAVVALALAARAEAAPQLTILAVALGYIALLDRAAGGDAADERWFQATEPWRMAAGALVMAMLVPIGQGLAARWPTLVRGPTPLVRQLAWPWLFATAAIVGAVALALHSADAGHRRSWAQLPAPYLTGAVAAVIGWTLRAPMALWAVAAAVAIGNIHLMRLGLGDWRAKLDLDHAHPIVLGLGLTLVQTAALRGVLRATAEPLRLTLASAILVALGLNYLVDPDLPTMSPWRFLVSGAMAALAGWWFRRAARAEADPERGARREIGYHAGIAVAVWCAALMIPWLRSPGAALIALALPAVWFHARAEFDEAGNGAGRWLRSAVVATAAVLAMYAFRPAFQAVAFPDVVPDVRLYHLNSWLAIALGLMALRQQGLGSGAWCGWLGGGAVIAGGFFLLTAIPGLGPIDHPAIAAACAVALAHAGIVGVARATPLAALARRLTGVDGQGWIDLRRMWGHELLVGAAVATAWGVHAGRDPRDVAPLIAGLASVLIHLGIVRARSRELMAAAALIAVALHADAWWPSRLALEHAVWAVLAWWALQAALRAPLAPWLAPGRSDVVITGLAALAAWHIAWQHPWSATGLVVAAVGAALAAATPRDGDRPRHPVEVVACLAVLAAPTWLAFWSGARSGGTIDLAVRTPWLAAACAVALTGVAIGMIRRSLRPLAPTRPLIAHQVARIIARDGDALATTARWIASAAAAVLLLVDHQRAASPLGLAAHLGLAAGLAIDWFRCGARERSLLANVLGQAMAVVAVVVVRRQLALTTDWWKLEYDVWATLACSAIATGVKQLVPKGERAQHLPLAALLLIAPAFALSWTVSHGLGTDLALVAIGLHSALFAWLGRGERDSPYHLVAVGGAVAFMLVLFAAKLHVREVHAYVVPVCLGVLVLTQLFAAHTAPATRSAVRLVALTAMLGSSAWYVLADPSHRVAFHATLLALSLLAMALGGILRVRLYLALGFAGVALDLVAIVAQAIGHAGRETRIAALGALVLLLGAALVGGAIAYKVHRAVIDAAIARWRERFARWE